MKASRYNTIIECPEGAALVYNTLSGAIIKVPARQCKRVLAVLADPLSSASEPELAEYNAILVRGRFLIEDHADEIDILKARNWAARFLQDKLGVTIMPTLDCNFRCSYCFEEHRNITMSEEVQDALVSWVEHEMEHRSELQVGWFGGEPLLRLPIMEQLTDRLKAVCERHGAEYGSAMSTNGYLLSAEVLRKIVGLGISDVQITLDGPRAVHDKRRPLADGRGTFEVICENLKAILQEDDVNVEVRVTIDRENVDAIYELIDLLADIDVHRRMFVNLESVRPSHISCISSNSGCLMCPAEFAKRRVDIQLYAAHVGFSVPPPGVICQSCPTQNINCFLVAPDGGLFKCGAYLREDDAIGRLNPHCDEKAEIFYSTFLKWAVREPFDKERCLRCEVLPICMGGCGALESDFGDNSTCCYHKYNLKKLLIGLYAER